jgi:hypothetical protein
MNLLMAVQVQQLQIAIAIISALSLWPFMVELQDLFVEERFSTHGANISLFLGYLLSAGEQLSFGLRLCSLSPVVGPKVAQL